VRHGNLFDDRRTVQLMAARRCKQEQSQGNRQRWEKNMSVHSINPTTGEILETLEETSFGETREILCKAHTAFLGWRTEPFSVRAECMREAGALLRGKIKSVWTAGWRR